MLTATISDFRKDIKRYLDRVTENFETLIINRGKNSGVVIISLDEYNSWKETLYLLSSPANAEHLRHSIQEAQEKHWFEKDISEP